MTLKQLEAFYWATTLGTFSAAAERLHVTQSSLSKRIAELEANIGHALFDRSTQRAKLTGAGEALLPHAQRMLDVEQAIRQGLQIHGELHGSCRLGISELSATTRFPSWVRRVHAEHPGVELKPQVGLGKTLERLVERGELDFAVVTGSVSSAAVFSQTIAQVDFAWMAAPTRLPTKDHDEAVAAFIEKRPPAFWGNSRGCAHHVTCSLRKSVGRLQLSPSRSPVLATAG